jgi:uncharacterized protein with FMN-binding domain
MRRITLWILSTVAAVVLLFSYRTSTMGPVGAQRSPSSPAGSDDGKSGTPTPDRSYRGEPAQTRWGPVQVAVTVSGGRITEVEVLAHPTGNRRSDDINAYALPILRKDTLRVQSADVDTVSGATVTSTGYRQSLQAAIDAAHL